MGRLSRQGVLLRRALIALALSLCAAAAPASAATVQVNTEADAGGAGCAGAPNDCSIRQAIKASSTGDSVAVPAGHYVLDPALEALFVDHDITIKGTGNPVIDGGGKIGVFSIGDNGNTFNPSFPDDVAIDGVTITGGDDVVNGGGGIVVYGTLTLTNSTVRDNMTRWDGGGIGLPGTEGPLGTLRLVNSTVSGNVALNGNGGGISSNGADVKVLNSTITGNSAGPGESVFDQNHAGGGISALQFGDNTVSLYNTTVAGNSLTGPGTLSGGNLYSRDAALLFLEDTIVTAGAASDGADCGGEAPVSRGHNLVPAGQCGADPALGDVSGDAKLGPLADNGGPTLTRKLLPGSAAIDAGDPNGCLDDATPAQPITPDQRTEPRPQGGRCDIGAVEFAPPAADTAQPTSVEKTSATLNGTVSNPHIRDGSAHFEFGTSTSYGQTFDAGSLASGASGDPRSQAVSGLSPGTTYHYRIVASNDDDTRFGPDVAFTTPSDPQPGPGPQPQPQPRPGPKPHPRRPKIRASRASASCVRNRFTARISVSVYNSTRVRSIRVTLDGRHLMRTKRRRFSVGIDARSLATGTHVLRVAVTDSAGRRSTFRRLFRRCRPPDRPLFTG